MRYVTGNVVDVSPEAPKAQCVLDNVTTPTDVEFNDFHRLSKLGGEVLKISMLAPEPGFR